MRRPTLTVPARGGPLNPQVGTKERPPGTNKGTAQTREAIDDVITNLTRRVLREDETTMEDGSSRRVRTLVTQMARRDLSGNKIACALIFIMARSTICSNLKPDTLMQDRISQSCRNLLRRTAGPSAPFGLMSASTSCGHAFQTTYGTRRSAPQSTTSSARISIAGGIVRPSVSIVFLLMMRRKRVGCSNGRSAGRAPLRIRSARSAARS